MGGTFAGRRARLCTMQDTPGGSPPSGSHSDDPDGPWPEFSEDELRRFTASAGNSALGHALRRAAGEGEDPMAVHDSYL